MNVWRNIQLEFHSECVELPMFLNNQTKQERNLLKFDLIATGLFLPKSNSLSRSHSLPKLTVNTATEQQQTGKRSFELDIF